MRPKDNPKKRPALLFHLKGTSTEATGRHRAVWIFLFLPLAVGGCEFPSDPQLRRVSILLNAAILGDAAFAPATVRVPLAGQVIWTNDDNIPHSIVGDATEGPCAFESPPLTANKGFKKAFFERVACNYYCGLHGRSMRGRIVVE